MIKICYMCFPYPCRVSKKEKKTNNKREKRNPDDLHTKSSSHKTDVGMSPLRFPQGSSENNMISHFLPSLLFSVDTRGVLFRNIKTTTTQDFQ